MQPSFEGFLRFAVEQPGDIRPGLSWGDFAVYLSRNLERARARFEIELRAYQEEPVTGKGGRADDPDRMSENKRITANIAALYLLRQMQTEGRTAPTAKEKTQLWRYSGWGGIDPAKLPLDAEAFPEDYLEAIRQWKRAVSQGQVPTSGLFQGLRHQFFTPLDVCRAMWALAQRAVIGPIDTALEPSVGVGRFLQAAPKGVKPAWTTVEADPLLSELVVAGHPGTWHFTETFEEHYVAWAALPDEERPYYSVVVMNPPYPDRPERDRKLDGRDWGKAHTYFVERASQMLRPGGVLVAITPAGEIVGTDAENHRLREVLLGRCHFVGAAFPPSNVFPGVNPLTNSFAIHAWVRLAAPAPLMEEARRLAAGHYAQLDAHTMGAWVEFGGRKTVKGAFDPGLLETMTLQPMPAAQRHAIDAWLEQYGGKKRVSSKKASAKPAKAPKIPSKSEVKSARKVDLAAMTRADADAVDAGQALSLRLQRFGALVAQQGAEGARAESGRAELIRDLRTFVARYGNPHQDPGIQERQRELAPLLTAIDPSGEISSVFLRPVSPYAFSAPPEGASPTELVFWYSRQRGVCTDRDLAQHGYVDAAESLIENPDVAVEPQADGSLWFYWFKPEIVEFPRTDSVTGDPVLDERGDAIIDQEVHAPAYLSGNLIPRIERVDAALTEVSDSALRAKLEHQKGQLMLALPNYSIGTIKPTPRSGIIPPECLQDYVNDVLRDRFQITDPQVTVAVDQARIKIRVEGPNKQTTLEGSSGQFIQMLLAYCNRESTVVDPNEKETKRTNVFYGLELNDRIKVEAEIEETFQGWLAANDTWSAQIETAYLREYGTGALREYDESPLGIARMSPSFVPGGHQNASVRRLTDQSAGVVNIAVGGGKCRRGADPTLTSRGVVEVRSLFGALAEGPEAELWLPAPPGLQVLSYVQGQPRWQNVARLYRQRISSEEATLVLETTRGGVTEVTQAHPFYVVREGAMAWVPAGELRPGDVVAMARSIPDPPEDPGVFPLAPGDSRLADLCVLLAWQAAGGNESEGTPRITQEDVRTLLKSIGWDGWGTLSADRAFPSWFTLLPRPILRQVLSAYFDGDGGVEDGDVSATSASEPLVRQVQYMLLRFGISASVHPRQARATNGIRKESSTYYRICIRGEDADRFRRDVGFTLPEKQALLRVVQERTRNPNLGIPVRDVLDQLSDAGVSWSMLGLARAQSLLSVSRPTLSALIARAEYLLGWNPERSGPRKGRPRARTADVLALPEVQNALRRAVAELRTRLAADFQYDVIRDVHPGERGGFVYDLEVDSADYDSKNYVCGRGAFIAHNTAVGLLTSAWWRQTGKGTRNVVVVPNNVLFNWFRECRKILPDYRIGLIGWSIDPVEGVKRQDSQDARLLKWSRFVQGDYDILLCPYSNFLNDVAMRDDTLLEMLSKVFWLERGLGIDAEDRALYERKLADLRAKLTEAEATLTSEAESKKNWEQRGWATATVDARIDKAVDRVERITKDIERLEAQLKKPKASVIAEVQQDLEDLTQRKPFRPRVRPDTGWKASWDLTTLVAFSDERGILFQDGRVWLTTSYEPPLVPSKEVRGWLDALEREPTGVLLWEGTKLTKKIVTDILRVFFPKGSTESEPYPRPPLVYWEDLDVDLLVVDEAHNFKNTWYAETRMGAKIEYMGSGSTADMGPQAWDMYWKCQELVARRKGGVILLTATVLKNSPLELYNLVSMVAPDAWKSRGTRCHEEFIDRYCKLEQAMVPTSEGAFKEALSMESWRDDTKQELLRVLDQYIDRRTIGELLRRGVIRSVPLPRIIRDETDLDPIADALYDVIVNRVGEITADLKKEKDEAGAEGSTRRLIGAVTLMLLDLLRKVTIDPRLLTTHLQDVEARLREKTAKVDAGDDDPALLVQTRALLIRAALLRDDCQAHTLIERYGDTILPKYAALAHRIVEMGPGCKHAIFSDFNETHGYIQDALIRLARVSPKRIAVMTGRLDPEERQAMALAYCGVPAEMDVLTGTVEERPEIPAVYDVIIGNSSVMAEGLNLQRGTCGVHHLTLPWEPATLEQRNGRAVRQGNTVEEVDVVYYLSRFSFDGIQLDKVLGKAGWMEQLYEPEVRSTGNPLAGAKFSRTEMLLLITMRKDPEGARALAMEIEERQREARLARARRNALASFETLVIEYARARRSDAEGTRRALFAAADVRAGNLRSLSDDVFPKKDLLDIARDRTVFLLFGGNYLIEGENVCFANARGDQRKFHIDSLQERSGVVVSRVFGTPVLQTAYGGLPGVAFAGETGWHRTEDCTWDSREDYTQIMAIPPRVGDLPQWDPKVIAHLGLKAIWANVRRDVDRGQGHYTFLPPKHAFIPLKDSQGRVHLMTPEASGRFNYGQAGALDQILPMIPQDPASWPDFLKALAQDRVDVYASRSEVRTLLSRDKDRETLDNTVVLWFRVPYGPGVRSINAALRAARRARGDADDEDSGKLRLSSRRASAAS